MGAFAYPNRKTPDVPNWTRELQKEWTWNHANEYFVQNVKGYLFGDVKDVQGFGVISFRLKHHMMFLPQDGKGPENIEFFLSPSEGTGDASCYFEAGDQIRFYGMACATTVGPETILETADEFHGNVDVYGLITWGIKPRVRPLVKGGSINIHPKAPAGTTALFVTPDTSSGLIKRTNYFKEKPGDTVSTIKGKKCWTLSPHEKDLSVSFLDIRVDYDQWRFGRIPKVKISLEYLDEGEGSIEVIYDAKDDTEKKLDTIMLSGSGAWKTWTRDVDDAMFARSIARPYRNDDLIFVTRTSKPLSVARVALSKE
jgi:hypothetical protein